MTRSKLIKAGIQASFETSTSKIADKICYGYSKSPNGSLTINEKKAQIVRFIFDRYYSGDSLGKIVNTLAEKKVTSPSGKDKWSRKVVDGLLSNEKYIGQVLLQKTIIQERQQVKNNIEAQYLLTDHHPAIISKQLFNMVQAEKTKRSNLEKTESGLQRKATKYNSTNVLSGLFICQECGKPYRRITRPGGEVVWRCANRVEYGKKHCKDSVTVTDSVVKEFLCRIFDMPNFNDQVVRKNVESVIVELRGNFEVILKDEQNLSMIT